LQAGPVASNVGANGEKERFAPNGRDFESPALEMKIVILARQSCLARKKEEMKKPAEWSSPN